VKISERQLRKIIVETRITEPFADLPDEDKTGIFSDFWRKHKQDKSEFLRANPMSDEDFNEMSTWGGEIYGGSGPPCPAREGKLMKISKKRLKRVIREQLVIDKTIPEHFDSGENIDVYGYKTKNFEVCATAVDLFEDDLAGAKFPGTERVIVEAAKLADKIFALEKRAVRNGFSTYDEVEAASELHQEFKDLIKELYVSDYNDKIAFMKMHLRVITKREE